MRGCSTSRSGRRWSANTETRPSGWVASHSPDGNTIMGVFGLRTGFIILKAESSVYLLPQSFTHSFSNNY